MFRFTIRELVLVMVSVSLAGAWWTDRRWLKAENRYLTYENSRLNRENEHVTAGRNEAMVSVKGLHSALLSQIIDEDARAAAKAAEAVIRTHNN